MGCWVLLLIMVLSVPKISFKTDWCMVISFVVSHFKLYSLISRSWIKISHLLPLQLFVFLISLPLQNKNMYSLMSVIPLEGKKSNMSFVVSTTRWCYFSTISLCMEFSGKTPMKYTIVMLFQFHWKKMNILIQYQHFGKML